MDCCLRCLPRFGLWPLTHIGLLTVVTAFCGLPANRLSAQGPAVRLDVPAIVIAEPVNPLVVTAPLMGGELMRLRVPVSSVIGPEYQGIVRELLIELSSPGQTMRVVDFWPRNETYSQYEGTVSVESLRKKDEHFAFNLGAAYPGVGQAQASGDYRNQLNVQESYQRRPPVQTLTSSGTIRQGFGVFYKFRPGPVDVMEGARDIAVLVEVPRGWRADLLQVRMTASGVANSGASSNQSARIIAAEQFWISTHREGDGEAAAQALDHVRQERHLRGLAATKRREVEKRSLPTLWHKVGAALDVVDSRIPQDYLDAVIFGPERPQFDQGTQRLPVDLRVAILDYWDQRSALLALSIAPTPAARDVTMAQAN